MFILQVPPTSSPPRNPFVIPAVTLPGVNLMQNANNRPPAPPVPQQPHSTTRRTSPAILMTDAQGGMQQAGNNLIRILRFLNPF